MLKAKGKQLPTHLTLLIVVAGCRTYQDAGIKDAAPISQDKHQRRELDINIDALTRSRFKFTVHQAHLNAWNTSDQTGGLATLDQRLTPYKIDESLPVSTELLGWLTTTASMTRDGQKLKINDFPGIDGPKFMPLRKKHDLTSIQSRDLSYFFDRCPLTFMDNHSGLYKHLITNIANNDTIRLAFAHPKSHPTIHAVQIHPRGITWQLDCANAISWSDMPDSNVLTQLSFNLTLETDRVIFPGSMPDPKFPMTKASELPTYQNGFGTRFFVDEKKQGTADSAVQRWNPKRPTIVIDDLTSASGADLKTTELGPWIQEALKIATADLRIKFPQFGQKIKLRSESPSLQADIEFDIHVDGVHSGINFKVVDDDSGEIRQISMKIAQSTLIKQITSMLKGFADLGLIQNPEKSLKESIQMMTIHELGHALGLRHNFEGYGMYQNWGNDLQSAMSYALLGIPIDFLTDRIEFKPHDILSLKILYADVTASVLESRQQFIQEIRAYPMSPDDFRHMTETEFSSDLPKDLERHLQKALRYLEQANNPYLSNFKASDPLWRQKIAAIYQTAYQIDLDF